jgi:hypothetical protein
MAVSGDLDVAISIDDLHYLSASPLSISLSPL